LCDFLIFRICETPPELKKHLFFLFKVYNSPIKIHGPWISKNLGTFIFKKSWTMIFGNSWSMIFKNVRNYVFQFLYFCDKKAWKKHTVEKTFIFLIQSILFSNGGLLHREKKFLFREILIIFSGGGFFKFHWSMPQWILFFFVERTP